MANQFCVKGVASQTQAVSAEDFTRATQIVPEEPAAWANLGLALIRLGDVNAAGEGSVSGQRLYQLIRQPGTISDRTFEIEFLDPGAQAFAFTFG